MGDSRDEKKSEQTAQAAKTEAKDSGDGDKAAKSKKVIHVQGLERAMEQNR